MSEEYSPTPVAQGVTVTVPQDGDNLTAQSVRDAIEEIADGLEYVTNAVELTVSAPAGWGNPRVSSAVGVGNTNVDILLGIPESNVNPVAVDDRATMTYPLDLPNGSTLTTVTAYVQGAAGATALPTAPGIIRVDVYGINITTGVATLLDTGDDASATLAAWKLAHQVSANGMTHVVNRETTRYVAMVFGEYGASQAAGTKYFGIRHQANQVTNDRGAA